MEADFNLIVGIHSIIAAIGNPNRTALKLFTTDIALDEIKAKITLDRVDVELISTHKVQELAKDYYRDLGLEYQRVPSGAFLTASSLETYDLPSFYRDIEQDKSFKLLCLDQITDVHNAAAILRTASFYGVDYVVIPDKKSFGFTPSFFRIASGAAEYVKLVSASKFTKVISKINDSNFLTLALSEHATTSFDSIVSSERSNKICLVLGREDVGISNAVLRLIDHKVSLESRGEIVSLNVSTAAAISMEKCFTK